MNKIRLFIFILIVFSCYALFQCDYAWLPCDYALFQCDYAWAEEAVIEPAEAVPATETATVTEVKKRTPPNTLISMKGTGISGYGGFYSRYSKIGDTTGWLLGGRGCVLLNDHFSFGGAGMGLVTPRDRGNLSGKEYTGIYDSVNFGYGGFLTEYYINPKSLIVFSFGALLGGGQLSFTEGDHDDDDDDDYNHGEDNFFVVEPELNVFVNITRFCRAGIGVSYRYVSGLHSKDFGKNDFNGPAGTAMIQFGWF